MSTGNVSIENPGQGTSDPFILSTSYDPTAAIQQQNEDHQPPEPSVTNFVENDDQTMITPTSVDCFEIITPTLEFFAADHDVDMAVPSVEIFATEPIENQDTSVPFTATLAVRHESEELNSQPLPMVTAESECMDMSLVSHKTNSYLDEVTGDL